MNELFGLSIIELKSRGNVQRNDKVRKLEHLKERTLHVHSKLNKLLAQRKINYYEYEQRYNELFEYKGETRYYKELESQIHLSKEPVRDWHHPVAIIAVIVAGLLLLGVLAQIDTPTGLIAFNKQRSSTLPVGITFAENTTYETGLNNITGLRISGSAIGNAKVYLKTANKTLLVYDVSSKEENLITGKVTGELVEQVKEEVEVIEEVKEEVPIEEKSEEDIVEELPEEIVEVIEEVKEEPIKEIIEEEEPVEIIEEVVEEIKEELAVEDIEEPVVVEKNETEIPVINENETKPENTTIVENATEIIKNETIELNESIIPNITNETKPVFNETNATIFNETNASNETKPNITDNVTIIPEINITENITENTTIIPENTTENVTNITEPEINITFVIESFKNKCIESCSVFLEEAILVIEVMPDSSITIDDITYHRKNQAPVQTALIPNITRNGTLNVTIAAEKFFTDYDGDVISFSAKESELTVTAKPGVISFAGKPGIYDMYVYATDGVDLTKSNTFTITFNEENTTNITNATNITNETLSFLKTLNASQIVINQPVLWIEDIRANKNITNISTTANKQAFNITVKKIINTLEEKIPENKILLRNESNNTNITIVDTINHAKVQYYTPGPSTQELNLGNGKRRIVVSSDIHYEDIFTYANVGDIQKEGIALYWINNSTRTSVNITYHDENNNSLIDYISWITPHLSEEVFELELTIINIQSYPVVGGTWVVEFNTTGTANLTISGINGTSYGSHPDDLTPTELYCDESLNFTWEGNNSQRENYTCNSTAQWTVTVHTPGIHTQKFTFGNLTAFAYNQAQPGWWNESWDSCKNITITNVGSTTLTNYPAFINVSNVSGKMNSDYSDLRFLDQPCSGGGSLMDYEIDNYTTDFALVWVKIPSLTTSDAIISMYYNNTGASSGENTADVWNTVYGSVWHMNEVAIVDSAGNNDPGSTGGNPALWTSCPVGNCIDFDGNDNINPGIDSSILFDDEDAFSFEIWGSFDILSSGETMYHQSKSGSSWNVAFGPYGSDCADNIFGFVTRDDDGSGRDSLCGDGTLAATTWYYFAGTYNNSASDNKTFYLNGKHNVSTSSGINNLRDAAAAAQIGYGGDYGYTDGKIDEFRLSKNTLSADWINQTYQLIENQGSFVTWSGADDRDVTVPTIDWEDPTPTDDDTIERMYVYLNTTVTDVHDTSAFFDWNASLLRYWSFDYANATGFLDNSTFGVVAEFNNMDSNNVAAASYGNGAEFNGVNEYLQTTLPSVVDVGMTQDFTIEVWLNENTFPTAATWHRAIDMRKDSDNFAQIGTTNTGTLFFIIEDTGTQYRLVATASANNWYHIVATWDASENDVDLYVNGIEETTAGGTAAGAGSVEALTIGRRSDGSALTYYNGTLDELKVHNHILLPEEINASYNNTVWRLYKNFTLLPDATYNYSAYAIDTAGNLNKTTRNITIESIYSTITWEEPTPTNASTINETYVYLNSTISETDSDIFVMYDFDESLVGYWNFEYYNSTGIFDNSSKQNFMWFKNGWTESDITSGIIGNGIHTDGNDKYAEAENSIENNYFETTPMSVEIWVKFDMSPVVLNDHMTLVKKYSAGNPWTCWSIFGSKTDGKITGAHTTDQRAVYYEHASLIGLGTWYHIVYVINGTSAKMYVNGTQIDSRTDAIGMYECNGPLRIGANDAYGAGFNGTIDEVKVWSRALTAEEVSASYNHTLAQFEKNFSDLEEGTHNYTAYSMDRDGDLASSTQTVTIDPWYVTDITNPTTASPQTVTDAEDINVSFNVSRNGEFLTERITVDSVTVGGETAVIRNHTVSGSATGEVADSVSFSGGCSDYTYSAYFGFAGEEMDGNGFFERTTTNDNNEYRTGYWNGAAACAIDYNSTFGFNLSHLNITGSIIDDISLAVHGCWQGSFTDCGTIDMPEFADGTNGTFQVFLSGADVERLDCTSAGCTDEDMLPLGDTDTNVSWGYPFDENAFHFEKSGSFENGDLINDTIYFILETNGTNAGAGAVVEFRIDYIELNVSYSGVTKGIWRENETWHINITLPSGLADGKDLLVLTNYTKHWQISNETETAALTYPSDSPPNITWEDPTPTDDSDTSTSYIYLNTTIQDDNNMTSFFDIDRTLQGYWSFENANATGVYDNSSYSHFGTFTNGIGTDNLTTGKFGNGSDFDGVDDEIVTTDFIGAWGEFTIIAWVYADHYPSGSEPEYEAIIATNEKGASPNGGLQYAIDSDGKLWIRIRNSANQATTNIADTAIGTGAWVHTAVTWDGSNVIFYLNGLDDGGGSNTRVMGNTDKKTTIGGTDDGTDNSMWDGKLDEIKIFNRVLTPAEINASLNTSKYPLAYNISTVFPRSYNYTAYVIDDSGQLVTSSRNTTVISTITVTLNQPLSATGNSTYNTSDLFQCTGTTNTGSLTSVALYTDIYDWHNHSIETFSATSSQRNISGMIHLPNVVYDKAIKWNCYFVNNESTTNFSSSNFTTSGFNTGTHNGTHIAGVGNVSLSETGVENMATGAATYLNHFDNADYMAATGETLYASGGGESLVTGKANNYSFRAATDNAHLQYQDQITMNKGSITFWYNNNGEYSKTADNMLFEISNNFPSEDYFIRLFHYKTGTSYLNYTNYDENSETSTGIALAGGWVHVAVTWESGLTDKEVKVYQNGASWFNSSGNDITNIKVEPSSIENLTISAAADFSMDVDGDFDEMAIYDSALSAATIAEMYYNQSHRKTGNYTSQIMEVTAIEKWYEISADYTPISGNSIMFQVRTSSTSDMSSANFGGPDGANSYYANYDELSLAVNKAFIQYKAYLNRTSLTSDDDISFTEVQISYFNDTDAYCTPPTRGVWNVVKWCNATDDTITVDGIVVNGSGYVNFTNVTVYINGNTTVESGGTFYSSSGSTIWQNGNITIDGTYILDGETLRMNGTSDGEFMINVRTGGNMTVFNNSNITNGEDTDDAYIFDVDSGATFDLRYSHVEHVGYTTSAPKRGLEIANVGSQIINNTFDYLNQGIVHTGGGITLTNNTVSIRPDNNNNAGQIFGMYSTGTHIYATNNSFIDQTTNSNIPVSLNGVYTSIFTNNTLITDSTNALYANTLSYATFTGDKYDAASVCVFPFVSFAESVNFINSSFTNCGATHHIWTVSSGNTNFINPIGFDRSKVYFIGGTPSITVSWYADFYVQQQTGAGISGATITAYNSSGTEQWSDTTDGDGWIKQKAVVEFVQVSGGQQNYNNYSFHATKTGVPSTVNSTTNASTNRTGYNSINLSLTNCGDTITNDFTLEQDMICSGDGLEIGAGSVTVNCANHLMDSDGTGTGIFISAQDNAIIANCTISNFLYGIRPRLADNSLIKNNTLNESTHNIYWESDSSHSTVKDNTFSGTSTNYHINFVDSDPAVVSNITIYNNTFIESTEAAIYLGTYTNHTNITSNLINLTGTSANGIQIEQLLNSTGTTTIVNNNITNATSSSIVFDAIQGTTQTIAFQNNNLFNPEDNNWVSGISAVAINVTSNYWGTTNETLMVEQIEQIKAGTVTYCPYYDNFYPSGSLVVNDTSACTCDEIVGATACDSGSCYNTDFFTENDTASPAEGTYNGYCCGDDTSENFTASLSDTTMDNGYGTGDGTGACCITNDKCVDNNICYTDNNVTVDADADGDNDFCDAGTWRDCNTDSECGVAEVCINNDCNPLPVMVTSRIDPAPTAYSSQSLLGYCNATETASSDVNYYYEWYVNGSLNESGRDLSGTRDVSKIVSGFYHSCGILTNGSTYCWGNAANGLLGNGMSVGIYSIPVPVTGEHNFTTISTEKMHTCGVLTNGSAYCWGYAISGSMGNGIVYGGYTNPVLVHGEHNFTTISAGEEHTCGILTNGSAYCWGESRRGQLGNGLTTPDQTEPVVVNGEHEFLNISAGEEHTCGILTNGSTYCWGESANGRLGNGLTTPDQTEPVVVNGEHSFRTIDLGEDHTCGVLTNGSAYCWGESANGRLGDGQSSTDRNEPTIVNGNHSFIAIEAGDEHTCGVLTNGSAYCWGLSEYGALGNGLTTPDQTEPVSVISVPFQGIIGYHTEGVEVLVNTLTNVYTSITENWTFSCLAYNGNGNSSWMNSSATEITDGTSPIVTQNIPANNAYGNTNVTFNCSVTDNYALTNITLHVWNSSEDLIFINETEISGTSNSSQWTVEFNYTNALSWNCEAYDSSDNTDWGATNYTLNLEPINISAPTFNESRYTAALNITCNATVLSNDYPQTSVEYEWYNETISGSADESGTTTGVTNNTNTLISTLGYGNTSAGDTWHCRVRAINETFNTSWRSASVDVNNKPTIPTLIYPTSGNTTIRDRTPTFNWTTSTDGDGDDITYTINVTENNGACPFSDDLLNTSSNLNFTPTSDLCTKTEEGSDSRDYNWSVKACDEFECSAYTASWNFSIQPFVSINITTNSVTFGTLDVTQSNDTEDDSPAPFVVVNDGNTVANLVNISANQSLWSATGAELGTQYLQMKAANVSSEGEAFNWSASLTTWVNVTSNNQSIIDGLNYTDANDSAEVDVKITVPNDEPAGSKSTWFVFIWEELS